jgi:hypothetical protein
LCDVCILDESSWNLSHGLVTLWYPL